MMLMRRVPGLMRDRERPVQRVAERGHRAPEVGQLETEDDVGVRDELAAARGLVERMLRREVHPPVLIDDRRLDRFGQLNQLARCRRACARRGRRRSPGSAR